MINSTQTQRENDRITTGQVLILRKLLVERYVSGKAFTVDSIERQPTEAEVIRIREERMAPVYRAWTTLIGALCDAKVALIHPNGRGISCKPINLTAEQKKMYQDTMYALRQVDPVMVFKK